MKTPTKTRKEPPLDSPSDFAGGSTARSDRRTPGERDFEREERFAQAGGQGTAQGAEPAVRAAAGPARRAAGRPVASTPTARLKGKASKRG